MQTSEKDGEIEYVSCLKYLSRVTNQVVGSPSFLADEMPMKCRW